MCSDFRTKFQWQMGCGMFSDQEGQGGKLLHSQLDLD